MVTNKYIFLRGSFLHRNPDILRSLTFKIFISKHKLVINKNYKNWYARSCIPTMFQRLHGYIKFSYQLQFKNNFCNSVYI